MSNDAEGDAAAGRVDPAPRSEGGGSSPRGAQAAPAAAAFLLALGRIVRLERLAAELTQQQLADRVGMSRSFLSLIEQGSHGIDVVRLLRLAAEFGRPLWSVVADAERRSAAAPLSTPRPGDRR